MIKKKKNVISCIIYSYFGNGVADRTTASVPTLTLSGSNLNHGQLLSLVKQLSRERDRHFPT